MSWLRYAGGAAGKALDAILRREENDDWILPRELDDSLWDRGFSDEDDLYSRDYDIVERDYDDFEE
jgi:hypothetical protein